MHRQTFEVTKVGDRRMSGLMKDTISMPRFSKTEIDFVAGDLTRPCSTVIIKIIWLKASPVLLAILEWNSQMALATTTVPRVQEPCALRREPVL
jgi:hypothetical protein